MALQALSFPRLDPASTLIVKLLQSSYTAAYRTDIKKMEVWHRRLGYLNKKYMSLVPKLAGGVEFGEPRKYKLDCGDCIKAS